LQFWHIQTVSALYGPSQKASYLSLTYSQGNYICFYYTATLPCKNNSSKLPAFFTSTLTINRFYVNKLNNTHMTYAI